MVISFTLMMGGRKYVMTTDGDGDRGETYFTASWKDTVLQSPRLLISLLLLAIFFVSLVVMHTLHRITAIPQELDIVLDSLLVILFLYPCIIFFVKRPYLHQIRERERSEAALSRSEARLRMILESNPYFMAVRDADGVVFMASKVFADFYGTSADRMIGVPQAKLHRAAGLNEEELEKGLAVDREVIETGKPRFGMEKMTHGDGRVHWYRYARLPVTMPSGVPCVLAIFGEITRRIDAEDAQRRAKEELERRVQERTAELVEANRKLQQVLEAHIEAEKELSISRAQLRNLSAWEHATLEEERKRISRELHDELGQSLTALKFDLAAAGNPASPDPTLLAAKTDSMIEFIDGILATVKKISRELRPGILDDLGLAVAIEWQAKEFRERTKIPCEVVVIPEDLTAGPEQSTVVFRIFQETLTNIARHADATNVEAILESRNGVVSLEVRDNGRGITKEEILGSKSLGLIGMRERARWLGGDFTIERYPIGGTVVRVAIPEGSGGSSDVQDPHRG
jgi:PAS domain S-box-containing protein